MDDRLPIIGGKFVDQVPTYLGREAVACGRSVWDHGFPHADVEIHYTGRCLSLSSRWQGPRFNIRRGGEGIWGKVPHVVSTIGQLYHITTQRKQVLSKWHALEARVPVESVCRHFETNCTAGRRELAFERDATLRRLQATHGSKINLRSFKIRSNLFSSARSTIWGAFWNLYLLFSDNVAVELRNRVRHANDLYYDHFTVRSFKISSSRKAGRKSGLWGAFWRHHMTPSLWKLSAQGSGIYRQAVDSPISQIILAFKIHLHITIMTRWS